MQRGDRLGRLCRSEPGLQKFLLALHLAQFAHHGRAAMALLDEIEQVADLPRQFALLLLKARPAPATFAVGGIDLGDIGANEFLDELWREKPLLEVARFVATAFRFR